MAKDPVCGMQVEEMSAQLKIDHDGQMYFFCCEGCLRSFEENPARYLAGDGMGHGHGSMSHDH